MVHSYFLQSGAIPAQVAGRPLHRDAHLAHHMMEKTNVRH
jgi:hypothetical protein